MLSLVFFYFEMETIASNFRWRLNRGPNFQVSQLILKEM
jgi:hypothetical protein